MLQEITNSVCIEISIYTLEFLIWFDWNYFFFSLSNRFSSLLSASVLQYPVLSLIVKFIVGFERNFTFNTVKLWVTIGMLVYVTLLFLMIFFNSLA